MKCEPRVTVAEYVARARKESWVDQDARDDRSICRFERSLSDDGGR